MATDFAAACQNPHSVRAPKECREWCDPNDQTMRIGEWRDDDAT
jgi:hypothetical protein